MKNGKKLLNRFLGISYAATTGWISPKDLIDNNSLKESIDKILRDVNSVRIIQMQYLRYRIKKKEKLKQVIALEAIALNIEFEIALVEKVYKKKLFTRLLNSINSLTDLYALMEKIKTQKTEEQQEKENCREYLENLDMTKGDKNALITMV